MQEKWNELQLVLDEMKTMKKREYFLTLAVCVMGGLLVGMLMSPKKRIQIASNNGNNNVKGLADGCECEYDCDEDCECK